MYKERLVSLLSDGSRVYLSEDVDTTSYVAEVSTEGGETIRRAAPSPIASARALSFRGQHGQLSKLMLYDFGQGTWSELANVGANDVVWSRSGDALYFDSPTNADIYRVVTKTRRLSPYGSFHGLRRTGFCGWSLNMTPDDQPALLREAGIHEVYSL